MATNESYAGPYLMKIRKINNDKGKTTFNNLMIRI